MGTPPQAERPSEETPKALIGYPPPNFGVLFSFFNTFTHLSQFFFGQSVLVSMNKKYIQPILLRVYHIFPKKSTQKPSAKRFSFGRMVLFADAGRAGCKNGFVSKAKPFLYDALYRQIFYSAKPRFIAAQIPKRASRQGGVSDSDTGDQGECTVSRQGPFRGPAFR